jgi:hypothetical protein
MGPLIAVGIVIDRFIKHHHRLVFIPCLLCVCVTVVLLVMRVAYCFTRRHLCAADICDSSNAASRQSKNRTPS